jgi:hypothetical protein
MRAFDELREQTLQMLHSRSEEGWQELEAQTRELLEVTLEGTNEAEANRAWFLNQVVFTRLEFIECVETMRKGAFYDAWCKLEQVEIGLLWLKRNPFLDLKTFGIPEIAQAVSDWQSLYPYKVFFSPEFVIKKRECGICGEAVDPWSSCSHEPGRVYHGKLCHRIVRDVELISISIVKDPVQKYSVAFASEEQQGKRDHYDYSTVKYTLKLVQSSFDRWKPNWTTALHPHSLFARVGPKDGCPCESGRPYADCCMPLPGVRRPHLSVWIDRPLPQGVPNFELVGYATEIDAKSDVVSDAQSSAAQPNISKKD